MARFQEGSTDIIAWALDTSIRSSESTSLFEGKKVQRRAQGFNGSGVKLNAPSTNEYAPVTQKLPADGHRSSQSSLRCDNSLSFANLEGWWTFWVQISGSPDLEIGFLHHHHHHH